MEKIDKMLERALQAQRSAYAVYSNFHVGVCIKTEDDALFSGSNVENASYPVGQCAEASAVGAMVTAGKRKIKAVVIVSPNEKFCAPCGLCRQKMFEFSTIDTPVHLYNKDGGHRMLTMGELLPEPFGLHNLEL